MIRLGFHSPAPACLLVLLLGLGGCVGKTYQEPETGLWSAEEVTERYGVDEAWWTLYDDAQLDALVDRALASNVDYARTALSVNRALYQAKALGSDLVPSFSAGGSASSTTMLDGNDGPFLPGQSRADTSRSYSANLSVSYELDLWGKLRRAVSAQEWEYRATEEDRAGARLALINNVVKSYYNLMYARQARGITERSLEFYTRLNALVEDKFRAGKVDGLEPATSRQAVLSARNTLLDLETQGKTAEQVLRNLLALRPDDPLPLEPRNLLDVPTDGVDLDVPVAALGLRPDIHAAEYRLRRTFDNWEAVRASIYPSITVGGSLSVSSREADALFDVPLLGGTVRINLPFLQWNKLRWNIKTSENQFEDAALQLTQKVNTALNEVDTYYFGYRNALARLDNLILKREADERISQYRESRYEAGVDELRDWIMARNSANESLLAVLRTKYSVIEYENALFQALGGRLVGK